MLDEGPGTRPAFAETGDAPARLPAVEQSGPATMREDAPAAPPAPVGPGKGNGRKRLQLPIVALAGLGLAGWYGLDWYANGRFIVSTEDAYVRADMAVIAAKVSGYVATVDVTDNTPVKAGDLLMTIDDGDYRLAVEAAQRRLETQDATIARIREQAKAQASVVAQADAGLASATADAQRAKLEYARSLNLSQTGFGTPQRVEQALADRDRTVAAVSNATAALNGARANLDVLNAQITEAERTRAELQTAVDRAQRDLVFTQVRAPFAGVVGNRAAQPGQFVQTGTRLMALVPLQSAYIEANFKETQLTPMKPGQPVRFTIDAAGGQSYEGTVESFAPASGALYSLLPPENATGNFTKIVQRVPVRIRVPAEVAARNILRPGLSVVVNVDTRDPEAPRPALLSALGFGRTK